MGEYEGVEKLSLLRKHCNFYKHSHSPRSLHPISHLFQHCRKHVWLDTSVSKQTNKSYMAMTIFLFLIKSSVKKVKAMCASMCQSSARRCFSNYIYQAHSRLKER